MSRVSQKTFDEFLKTFDGIKKLPERSRIHFGLFFACLQYMPLNLHMILSVDKHSDIDTNAIIDKAIKRYFVQPV